MLSIQAVEVRYGSVRALKDVSFEVPEGRVIAMLGANGAGKTTTLNTISGLLRPSAGSIHLRDERIDGVPPEQIVKRGISMVAEGRRLFSEMTVLENLQIGAFVVKNKASVKRSLEQVFAYFPILRNRNHQLALNLSGGEQQMLAIARALMSEPRLILLDEPSLGLAPLIVSEIFHIIGELNESGITILIVEQNPRKALQYAHRAYVLEVGGIVLEGTKEDLESNERFRDAYLGAGAADRVAHRRGWESGESS